MTGQALAGRVVAVLDRQQGSGVLLGPRLVLTSAHLLGPAFVPTVAHPDREGTVACAVAWAGDPRLCDAAVLITAEDIVPPAALGRLRLGRVDSTDPLRDCQTIGFPDHQRYDVGELDLGQYTGSILPLTGKVRGSLAFWLDQTPGLDNAEGPSPLAGMSGAPVFVGPVLVGIVAAVAPGERHEQLEAVPIDAIFRNLTKRVHLPVLSDSKDLPPVPSAPATPSYLFVPEAATSLDDLPTFIDFSSGPFTDISSGQRIGSDGLVFRRRLDGDPPDADVVVFQLPALEYITGFHPEDARYEQQYARALKAQYRKTEIFGIDELGISEASWDLDTAYLSLEAAPWNRGRQDLFHWAADNGGFQPPADESRPQRVEALLGARRRALLRGEAGAGKTTLVWWLASHAACGTLAPELDQLNGLVPFVVPLRNLRAQGGGYPTPDDLPRVARLPVGQPPPGWAERVLESGRAFLLVDGLDELPDADRTRARGWLVSLLDRFRATRCLATVRPGAVEAQWLTSEGFAELLLLPMSDADINAFVVAWHSAARLEFETFADPLRAAGGCRHLSILEHGLRREFERNRTLRDLARTPLLCAVICALHRKSEGRLPSTRWELYQATLGMLLGKRDVRRGIDAPEGLKIDIQENKLLLQHIAVWLVRNGRTQLSHDEALTQIYQATLGMPQILEQGSYQQVLTHLLNRTGLLQEHTEGYIQFIHRTFQDYLAAKEFAETDSLNELLQHAYDEQWHDVIRLAVGHFDRRRVGMLIADLGERGDAAKDPKTRRELYVLAAQCAEAAVYLDEETRNATQRRIRTLMPPTQKEHVRELSALGSYVLPLLPRPKELSSAVALLVVDTLAQIGDNGAMARMREFATDSRAPVRRALVKSWTSFPADDYARDVLAHTRLDDIVLDAITPDQLRQLRHCAPAPSIAVEGSHSSADLARHLPHGELRSLAIRHNHSLLDLNFLQAHPSLSRLSVLDCPKLASLCSTAPLPALEEIVLDAYSMCLSDPPPAVRTLQLRGDAPLPLLSRWKDVRHLSLTAPTTVSAVIRAMQPMTAIEQLSLEQIGLLDLENTDTDPRINRLRLACVDRYVNTAALARVFPSLRHLELEFAAKETPALYEIDFSPLETLPELTVRVLVPTRAQVETKGAQLLAVPVEFVEVP